MRQILWKYWAVLSMTVAVLAMGACGPSEVCNSNEDCTEPGQTCNLDSNECVYAYTECFLDEQCESYERCDQLVCVPRESCEVSDHCPPGEVCTDGGECVAEQCKVDGDCFDGWTCDEGLCTTQPRQCQAAGQPCDPEMATRDGFSCEDLGKGPSCYKTCNPVRVCQLGGIPSTRYECGNDSVCVEGGVSTPICRPSECGGYFSAEEDCAAYVEGDPKGYENGVHCASIDGQAFICEPAGLAEEGDRCSATADCAEGLLCVNQLGAAGSLGSQSFCAKACNSDDMCGEGQGCIGDDTGVYDGAGFCGDRCEPFGTGEAQCDAETACVAVSNGDGACFRPTTRTAELYESCTSSTDCPDNSDCVGLSAGENRCLPLCNPTLGTDEAQDASCPGPTTYGYVQLANLGQNLGEIEVYMDGVLVSGLESGESTSGESIYLNIEGGTRDVEVRDADTGDLLYAETIDIAPRSALAMTVIARSSGAALITTVVPRNVSADAGEAKVRFINELAGVGALDVVLVEAGEDMNDVDARLGLVEGLDASAASEFKTLFVDVDADEKAFDIYVVPAGSADVSEAYVVVNDFELQDGEVSSIYIAGDLSPADPSEYVEATLQPLQYASAPRGRALGGYCYDLNAQSGRAPEIGSGICLETCRTSSDWGSDSCTNPADSCSPVGSNLGWCFPAGTGERGNSCESDDDCGPALFCDGAGSDHGTCRSLCQPTEQVNPELVCDTGEVCVARPGYENLGECRLPCDPGENYVDTVNCPVGLQNCIGEEGAAFCSPSGTLGLGEDCGSPIEQSCAPGLVCAQNGRDLNGVIFDPFSDLEPGETATCRQLCEPFSGEDSGCGEGFACSPITPAGESTVLGHCVERTEFRIPSLADCPAEDIGKMCDQNSFCIPASSNMCMEERGQCLQFCDYATGRGCTGGTRCVEGFVGGPLLGVFGLCQ